MSNATTLDELASQILQDKQTQTEQSQTLQRQAEGIWRSLSTKVENLVKEGNSSPRVLKLAGGISFERTGNGFDLKNQLMPAIDIEVRFHDTFIGIQRRTARAMYKSEQHGENLPFVSDRSGRVYLTTESDQPFKSIEETAIHILQPLLTT